MRTLPTSYRTQSPSQPPDTRGSMGRDPPLSFPYLPVSRSATEKQMNGTSLAIMMCADTSDKLKKKK